jgi:hypothetical protein
MLARKDPELAQAYGLSDAHKEDEDGEEPVAA